MAQSSFSERSSFIFYSDIVLEKFVPSKLLSASTALPLINPLLAPGGWRGKMRLLKGLWRSLFEDL